jgi:DeoR family fructose operon transcriptional repressor
MALPRACPRSLRPSGPDPAAANTSHPAAAGEEPPFALRAHEAVDAKRRIAAEVSRLIADGETVLLDSATTCVEVARLLHGRQVTVMPLSLQATRTLSDALASLAALRFDTAVSDCCGLSAAEGFTAYDLDDAAVKKAIIASTRRIIAAAADTTAPADEVAALEGSGTVVKTA